MCSTGVRKIGILAIALSIFTTSASANVLDNTDRQRLRRLFRNAVQLQRDFQDLAGSTKNHDTINCVLNIKLSLERVGGQLDKLETLTSLSTLMIDRSDEHAVLNNLISQGETFAMVIGIEQSGINKLTGTCTWIDIVPVTQELLSFYSQALSGVSDIVDRVRSYFQTP